jgi:hypothetical protein
MKSSSERRQNTTLHARGDGTDVPGGRQHVVSAREPPCRMLARPAYRGQTVTLAPEWYPISGRVYLGLDPARACVSPQRTDRPAPGLRAMARLRVERSRSAVRARRVRSRRAGQFRRGYHSRSTPIWRCGGRGSASETTMTTEHSIPARQRASWNRGRVSSRALSPALVAFVRDLPVSSLGAYRLVVGFGSR